MLIARPCFLVQHDHFAHLLATTPLVPCSNHLEVVSCVAVVIDGECAFTLEAVLFLDFDYCSLVVLCILVCTK